MPNAHSNPRKARAPQQQKKIKELINYLPRKLVSIIQSLSLEIQRQVLFSPDLNDSFGEEVDVYLHLLHNVLLKKKNNKRSNIFLRMLFNPIDEKLNEEIQRCYKAEEVKLYFLILEKYSPWLVNSAKYELREMMIKLIENQLEEILF